MKKYLSASSKEKGQSLVFVALAMILLLGFAAMSIDFGYLSISKDELRRTADAAALAAASQLIKKNYEAGVEEATHFAQANSVAGTPVVINPDTDVEYGQMRQIPGEDPVFVPGATPFDSVRVTVRRTKDANGALPTFFAGILGHDQVEMTVSAVASVPDKRVMFVLDVSGSMDDDTVRPPDVSWWEFSAWKQDPANWEQIEPIHTMKVSAIDFIERLDADEDKIGLVSYSSSATLNCEMTFNFQAVSDAITALVANGYTNIGDGMYEGLQQLEADPYAYLGTKVIVLLSDGNANRPGGSYSGRQHALDMADDCADAGVRVYTISLGDGADRDLMEEIAEKTDAATFHAPTTEDLPLAFNTIFERIPPRLSM